LHVYLGFIRKRGYYVRAVLLFAVTIPRIAVEIDFCGFSLESEVVRELALVPLGADSCFVEGTEDGLGVLACGKM